jgi:flagellar hook assembly protein FlgD
VLISVRDLKGTLLRVLINKGYKPGEYELEWDGRGPGGQKLSPGIYMITMMTPESVETTKIVMME